jgi:uncharacterized protein DUF6188
MSPFDVSWMVGRKVNVAVRESSYPWFFGLGDSCSIIVECPWRILQKGEIRHSSENHAMKHGLPPPIHVAAEANRLLNGSPIVGAEIRQAADLLLDFDGEVRLEVLPFVPGYESWQLHAPEGRHILAGVDGTLSAW